MTLIGVKSKYGSGRGTCSELININNKQYILYIQSTDGKIYKFIEFIFIYFGSNPGIGFFYC